MLLFKYLKASKTNRGRFWFRYIQPKIRINRQSEEERYIYPGHQVAPASLTPPSRPDRKGKTDSPNIKPRLMELLHAFSTNSTVCSLTACTSPSYTAGGAIHAAWGRLHWARCWGTTLWFFNIFNIPNGLQYISCLHTWSFDFLVQQAAELFFHCRHKGLTLNSPHVYVYLFIYTLTVILAYNFFYIYLQNPLKYR